MNEKDYKKRFDSAIESMTQREPPGDLAGFEHGVWTEIALQNRSDWRRIADLVLGRGFSIPIPIAACVAVLSIAAGAAFGMSQGDAYGRKTSLALEERYVQTIHPVMRSEIHGEHAPH